MPFRFDRLTQRTRVAMLAELQLDMSRGRLDLNPRLTEAGQRDWPHLLETALRSGDSETLAKSLKALGVLRTEERRRVEGDLRVVRVPRTFAVQLADDAFNHYYVRAICLRAIGHSLPAVQVYRAKPVEEPRPDSEARVGTLVDPRAILEDLRQHGPEDVPTLGIPGGPNSGLSVRIP